MTIFNNIFNKLLILFILGLIGFGIYWFFFVKPKKAKSKESDGSATQSDEERAGEARGDRYDPNYTRAAAEASYREAANKAAYF